MKNTGFYPAEILIPKVGSMEKWSCIACDQFTSEKEYWDRLKEFVGDAKSTLNLTLPEIYLSDDADKRIVKINENIRSYLDGGTFCELDEGYILTVRSTRFVKRRIGIVACVDLEDYDYKKGVKPLVRATEGTIEERIPPRLKIRENAEIELPHIMILYDDERREIAENLYDRRNEFKKLYDFDLNMDGGHIEGYFIPESENLREKFAALLDEDRLKAKYGKADEFAFAVGDGNHSLATAKAHWERVKATLKGDELKTHPARFALAEFNNIYDEGIYFEPIFRFVKGVNAEEFKSGLKNAVKGHYRLAIGGSVEDVKGDSALPTVISEIDKFIKQYVGDNGGSVDYVHGEENVLKLVKADENAVAVMPDKLNKSDLFKFVSNSGALPRKTFSMGEGIEKRYYLEAKKIKNYNKKVLKC
ncbi:MAG: DUF1015 domain-containing protein [Clostridia bacterium]|nr:DUF1015 domain-containing protein [Clostridia bacterium]